MPAPTPFASTHNQPVFPALYLYPLNDSFVPKHITLVHNQRVKIGRQTNAKTSPAERNGYFDSKVLSRQHAEVWEEAGKIYIKDVKSSNGTFINGERLSPEGLESEPYQLNSDDIVEFGIDIVGEDNKTIIHHKVAARVVCVFSEQDAQIAARAEQHQQHSNTMAAQAGPSGGSTFNFQNPTAQRRPPLQQQGIAGMGGMGGSMRPPGKSGLTFDHILSRLQGELQKSRETGAELNSLTTAMNDIHDTLGGQVPSNLPQYPQVLPPVRTSQTSSNSPAPLDQVPEQGPQVPALSEIQTQLHDTQSSLSTHMDRIRALEGVLAEHEAIKREVAVLRELMEERRRVADGSGTRDMSAQEGQAEDMGEIDDDDARSVETAVPRQLDRVDEEDEDQLAAEEDDEDRRRRRDELGRPRTPEPSSLGMSEDDFEHSSLLTRRRSPSPDPREKSTALVDELTMRLTTLSEQLESAIVLSNNLQAQHVAAQSTISALEGKVSALESLVHATQAQTAAQGLAHDQSIREAAAAAAAAAMASVPSKEDTRESLSQMLTDWKKGVEGQWSNVQEEWHQERERLHRAREEWEGKFKAVEIGLNTAVAKVDSGLQSINLTRVPKQVPNGDAHGLATPPSPRSESERPRRRRRVTTSRGRSRSRSDSQPRTDGSDDLTDSSTAVSLSGMQSSLSTKANSPNSDNESEGEEGKRESKSDLTLNGSGRYLVTPAPSSHTLSTSQSSEDSLKGEAFDLEKYPMTTSAALGVVVLGVAAAAVIWRVRPES